MNIGFFDSGLGGLLVLKAVTKTLPQYDYIYYADTANLPYGDKSEEEIYEYTKTAIEDLCQRDCLLIVVACNSASAMTLRKLQDTFLRDSYSDRRVLGVIIPTIEELVVEAHPHATLIATKRTIDSQKYERELAKVSDVTISLTSIATPELVPLIESHQFEAAVAAAIKTIEEKAHKRDVIILGCTHYILLKDRLREHFGSSYTFISQDEVIPNKLQAYLERHPEIESRLSNTGKRIVHLTEHRPDYDRLTAEFLGGIHIPDDTET